jgi:hypothetical protein
MHLGVHDLFFSEEGVQGILKYVHVKPNTNIVLLLACPTNIFKNRDPINHEG